MIQSPGLYAMSEEDYRADPCPEPSLNQSTAKVLLRSCPYAAWYVHPQLNPKFSPKEEDKFNLANVAHRLLLGRGKEYRTVMADDWRAAVAREQKQAIRNSGFVPILERQLDQAASMVNVAKSYLKDHPDGTRIFKPDYGDGEMVIACLDRLGCWTRAMVDWLEHRSPDGNNFLCVDYKTTRESANPLKLTKQQKVDWAFQAAFQKRVLDHIKPDHKARFLFFVQETDEPWLCSLNEPSGAAMAHAEDQVAQAVQTWCISLNSGVWPPYAHTVSIFDFRWPADYSSSEMEVAPLPVTIKRRGRPKMTDEQKAEAKAKRKAARVAAEYLEERKEIVTNDDRSNHHVTHEPHSESHPDGDTL